MSNSNVKKSRNEKVKLFLLEYLLNSRNNKPSFKRDSEIDA